MAFLLAWNHGALMKVWEKIRAYLRKHSDTPCAGYPLCDGEGCDCDER